MKAIVVVDPQNDFCEGGSMAGSRDDEQRKVVKDIVAVIATSDVPDAKAHYNEGLAPFGIYVEVRGEVYLLTLSTTAWRDLEAVKRG